MKYRSGYGYGDGSGHNGRNNMKSKPEKDKITKKTAAVIFQKVCSEKVHLLLNELFKTLKLKECEKIQNHYDNEEILLIILRILSLQVMHTIEKNKSRFKAKKLIKLYAMNLINTGRMFYDDLIKKDFEPNFKSRKKNK